MIWLLNSFIILTPFAWGTSTWLSVKAITSEPTNWRNREDIGIFWQNRASVSALGIVTVVGLLWLPAGFYAARHTDTGNIRIMDQFAAMAVVACGLALILSLLDRPKLIAPIVVTCVGTASFWFGTTIP